jgi:hypothetical protein
MIDRLVSPMSRTHPPAKVGKQYTRGLFSLVVYAWINRTQVVSQGGSYTNAAIPRQNCC